MISLLFGAPCALAEAVADDPAVSSEKGQPLDAGARRPDDSLRFEGVESRPGEEQRYEIFGIPLRRTLKEGLTMGVTSRGIMWKVDW